MLAALNFAAHRDARSDLAAPLRAHALHLSPGAIVFLALLGLAVLAGIGLVIVFLALDGEALQRSPRPRVQSPVLLLSFLAYMVGFMGLSLAGAVVVILLGVDEARPSGAVFYLAVQSLSMLGALALGLAALRWLTSQTREDPHEIGWRSGPLGKAIAWGMGGYCAALPFMVAGVIISQQLSKTFFKHIETPEHPIVPLIARGGPVFIAAAALAVVVAPLVEETFFRGMLYNALRGWMGVWPASIVSGAVFAIVHPTLPAGFLPIMALGCVLAMIRERTGSLVPCMVCHAINNAVALALVRLVC